MKNIEKYNKRGTRVFDVNGKSVPNKLDRGFYINMAKERVQGYGI